MPYSSVYFFITMVLLGVSIAIYRPMGADNPRTDVLIIAPHPDDAVLCCAGLIQQSLKRGDSVRIINITDGDGYQEAAAALTRKPTSTATPTDMLRLGRIRRKEEITALGLLGISKKNIHFLGYPDGLLEEVYNNAAANPFTNPFTRRAHTPAGNPFTKAAIAEEIAATLARHTPRHVYVTGMQDTALDHQIAYRLVMDGINKMGFTGTLRTYIIHTEPDAILSTAPAEAVNLTQGELLIKRRAIGKYKTQMIPDGDYLMSFARDTERFY